MSLFLCKLWPYLAGGLIGWLLAGWLARRLKHSEPPVEKIIEKEVEKIVDNPDHLALISDLEKENKQIPGLIAQVAAFEESSITGIGKDSNALDKENSQVTSLMSQVSKQESQVKEKIIHVDNPELLAKLKKLEAENRKIHDLEKKLKASGNKSFQSLTSTTSGSDDDKDQKIKALEKALEACKQGPKIDLEAARAAGIKIKDEHDLTAIEGIGPKISDLIKKEGINTFSLLADTQPDDLKEALNKAGPAFKMANPGTWPDQANLAANNRWPALKALQDVLIGGVYPDTSSSANSSKKTSKTKATTKKEKPLDLEAAKAAGFKLKVNKDGHVDFTLIEGIGPKINELFHNAGIHTFPQLAKTYVDDIQKILDEAGPRFKLAKPGTWPAQAEMAASNKWDKLKAWQDKLDGGVES